MSTILVVEQEERLRRLYARELSREGDVVRTAENAADGVRAFEADRPDLVVLGVGLPPNDGLRVVERMIEVDRTIPIVLNTTCRSYADDPLGWAVDAYVDRSSDTRELQSMVRELLHPRTPAPVAPRELR